METYFNQFNANVKNLFTEINQYVPTTGINEFFELIDNPDFDHSKLIAMIHYALEDKEEQLRDRNYAVFENKIKLFPGVYLNKIWEHLDSDQQPRIMDLLLNTYVLVELMWQETKQEAMNATKRQNINKMMNYLKAKNFEIEMEFNPYEGVIADSAEGFGVDELFGGPDVLPNSDAERSGGLMNMIPGSGSGIDFGELKTQLLNMKKEDIDDATENIKQMLGAGADEGTAEVIGDMLHKITDELKEADFSSGNPFESVQKIAQNVANQMKGSVAKKPVNWEKILNSTGKLANEVKDTNGNNLFDPNMMGMLQGMMNQAKGRGQRPKPADMVAAQKMMKELGLSNVNMGKIKKSKKNRKK
jgi:hypothetical protein